MLSFEKSGKTRTKRYSPPNNTVSVRAAFFEAAFKEKLKRETNVTLRIEAMKKDCIGLLM